MIAHRSRPRSRCAWVALAAWWSLPCTTSCLSADDAPAGGRVEHPPRAPVLPAEQAQDGGPFGEQFSQLDYAIANDCDLGPRPWSKNVPDRDCTRDDECGDGFCDRGRCAAIRTCHTYGQRCINGHPAPTSSRNEHCFGICVDGRCRSCESDAECIQDRGRSDSTCNGHRGVLGRLCGSPWPNRM
jgi:hypothetical protein